MPAGNDVTMAGEAKEVSDCEEVEEEEDLYVGDDAEEDEDIDLVDDGSTLDEGTRQFDTIINALGDILVDPEFEELRESFCRSNCSHFEDTDENKLIYTDIFERYVQLVETAIDSKLKAAVPGFDMQSFSELLSAHKDKLMSEVFDLLVSLGDFEAFKEVMLSYKQEQQEGTFGLSGCAMKIYTEEQEDGEERPDLDFGLSVSSLRK